ncbi:MAG: penicillin-binding protein 2 [Candidatus Komeilibacteria bacterium CG11_big_fil_rev_8_21_14_0_20_36_20]|uniref:Penicillin-binding protein 2 n=2 Tax=Patescibacteria group TaxID=1783273 RepID=A0A2H0NBQ3_9BACT|nr:MAG: penicillin-binding protein 2 [Candidatus Komeilibacteria bacterium CG11_big_fil_rev_8_21_14_0_20_36_20]PIR81464.1 MAG: penicillin-binding protein 2 [Candidatus Komeilibacteria bacterium CG10_big_fil_rev_8_21_14_0_10_36_65]PIZ66479.1 MAG: penicillin-binding protein 2 [Candidatus Roizmanbacteria bacterium CG_4_10_14_0_2_um_filter_36_9]PJC55665.1 MAG: penicillin-binding protein 2 [Candidatus Komeilibacteria bacterium CG_4_9_14_0_2_um_filter_36_13]
MKSNPFKIQEGSVGDAKVAGFVSDRDSGNYLDLEAAGKSQYLGKFFDSRRSVNLSMVFLFLLLTLFIRAVYLQVIRGDNFRNIAEGNRIRSDIIPSNRGLIYDRFGNLLVKNESYFFLYLTSDLLPEDELTKEKLFDDLANVLKINKDEIKERINTNNVNGEVLIYENLEYEQAIQLMIMSEDNLSIKVTHEPRRQYFAELGLSHILGYLGAVTEDDLEDGKYQSHDRLGKSGIELIYEDVLKGRDGIRHVEVDALYRDKNIVSMTEPIDGSDIVLTIDAQAQKKLAEIMDDNSVRYNKPKMAAVVLDAKDGGVLAMNSLPTFDNNIFTTVLNQDDYQKIISDPNAPLLNRAMSGTYPLGSIFKTVVGSAALEEGLINASFTVRSTGGVTVGNNFFPDWRPGGHGLTNIYWAIADSVNTFFYSIGGGNNQWLNVGLGVDKMMDYAKKFGLGKETGIDLNMESAGFLPSKEWKEKTYGERWYLGDTYNLSIGQGYLLATPLQAAVLMSYFANNGQVYQPHLIRQTEEDKIIEDFDPQLALTNIISSDNLNIIRQGLRETVARGTAQSLQSVPVKVAAKTGTAQFNNNKSPHSWLAAFAPYDDAKIVITVMVEEGGDIGLAVTIAREFMEWYFSQ